MIGFAFEVKMLELKFNITYPWGKSKLLVTHYDVIRLLPHIQCTVAATLV